MKAILYTRISRLDDEFKDDPDRATKRQEEDCRNLCKARGWEVVEVYSDEDLSGYQDRVVRDEYDRLKADVESGKFSDGEWVVVTDVMTRVGRNRNEIEYFILEVLEPHGVGYTSVKDPDFDTTTATGRLVLRILATLAQFESELMGERIARQRKSAAQRGKPSPGGRRPFGYKSDGMTIIKSEANLIRAAAKEVLAGKSYRSIADDWAKRKIKTPSGNDFRPGHISRILRSARVAGRRSYKGQTYDAQWPAIIDVDTQRQLLAGATKRGPKGDTWPLTGILRCGLCGSSMNAHNHQQGGRRYRCVRGPGLPGCGSLSVIASQVEDILWNEALGRTWQRDQLKEEEIKATLTDLRKQQREVAARLQELEDSYWQHGSIPRKTYDRQSDTLRDRIELLQTEIDTMRDRRAAEDEWTSLVEMVERYENATPAQKRALMTRAFERVDVAPAKPGKWFDPERLTITWA